ncbi:MAG: metal-dependent hydrolase [Oleibacter sp.]|nr:metal-dependent hydrolase [Thalassolituus sp.]
MTMNKPTPREISSEVEIQGRKMDFDFKFEDLPRYWFGNDAFKTTLMNALSCLFLEGERLFIDAVRDNEHLVTDAKLKQQVKHFIKQEAIHGHEHHMLSEYLDTLGYPATKVEAQERAVRLMVKKYVPAKDRLAITCAVEHFTAMLAHQMLTNHELTRDMDPRILEMWKWHAVEETEHKAVCFDVYEQTGGSYLRRVLHMATITMTFMFRLSTVHAYFLWKDKQLFKWSTWKSGFNFYWKAPGLLPAIWQEYKDYYRRDFHPWENDNRELLEGWKANHENYKAV